MSRDCGGISFSVRTGLNSWAIVGWTGRKGRLNPSSGGEEKSAAGSG